MLSKSPFDANLTQLIFRENKKCSDEFSSEHFLFIILDVCVMNRIAAAQTELEESRYRNSLVNEQILFLTFYYLFSFFNLSICIENYIFDDKFLYSRNQHGHCIIIRFPVFRRKLHFKMYAL